MHAGDLRLRLLYIRQDSLAALKIRLAFLGHAELARRPVQQANAEPVLEPGDLLADGRRREPQSRRRR